MFSVAEIIDIAIQIEKNGEAVYRNALKGVSDRSMISLLVWLADEEVRHKKWFSKLKTVIPPTTEDPELEEIGREVLRAVVSHKSFSLDDSDLTKIREVDDLLDLAIEFETDTVVFFEMIRAFIDDPETLEQLDAIIDEEKRHVQVLREFKSGESTETEFVSADTPR